MFCLSTPNLNKHVGICNFIISVTKVGKGSSHSCLSFISNICTNFRQILCLGVKNFRVKQEYKKVEARANKVEHILSIASIFLFLFYFCRNILVFMPYSRNSRTFFSRFPRFSLHLLCLVKS